jgi:predicted 2-oxoglutarate/Fe(II)-dependent dioxygenase YbiX
MSQHKRFKLIVDNLLTEDECKKFIDFAEKEGFEEALIQQRGDGQVMNKDIRDNDRVVIDLPDLASELYDKVKEHLPEEIEGFKVDGLNERFRFYRYKDGQQFKVHPDGHFKKNDNEISMVTMIIYLNEDFEGGNTEFVMPWENIEPKTGKLLLFRHNQLHKGNPVPVGTKYVLRTDVMYKKD